MKIAPDKAKHFLAGGLVGLSALFVGWYALVLVVIVGIGKEVYDEESGKGTPEVMDALAACAGGLLVVGLIEVANYFWRVY
jgi:hypothetical protein